MCTSAKRGARVTESTVSRALMRALQQHLPNALPIRHEDKFTKGVPDLSISYKPPHASHGMTSWWELKYAAPDCHTTKVQRYMCQQLDQKSFCCRYVVFRRGHADKWPRQIRVVKPHDFDHWRTLGRVISSGSFDYAALVRYILEVHERHHHPHSPQ